MRPLQAAEVTLRGDGSLEVAGRLEAQRPVVVPGGPVVYPPAVRFIRHSGHLGGFPLRQLTLDDPGIGC
jgi:hypothetical protein